jgi:hypothetical protein
MSCPVASSHQPHPPRSSLPSFTRTSSGPPGHRPGYYAAPTTTLVLTRPPLSFAQIAQAQQARSSECAPKRTSEMSKGLLHG